MSGTDAVLLARAQFAFTIGFHIVLPAFTIGLASYLAVLEALWLATGRQVYLDVFHNWLKAFAIVFAMGVVSGVVMVYRVRHQLGEVSDKTGAVVGPLMGCEVVTAFFLEPSSSASCCSAGSAWDEPCTSSPPCWWPSAR